ncbi:MAG: beta strand repeat-containing protein, partial [Dolichospermum sp.]
MKICAVLLLALLTTTLFAQTAATGDYRSVQSGNWSATSTWQVRDGSGNWTTPASTPTSSNNVYIQLLHKVVVDVATASCNDLHLQTTDSLGIGSNTLEVSGKIRSYNSYQITTAALTSNVATITTSAAHGLTVGQSVIILGLSGSFVPLNGTYTIASTPTTTTFTYALTNADIASSGSGTTTGSVTRNAAAVTSGVDGTFYSTQVNSTAINGTMCTSTSGAGGIKFIGNTRNITNTGEWTGNSISLLVDFNFALNSGQTGTLNTVFGGRNLTFTSGTVIGTTRVTPGGGAPGTGTVTIKSGATYSSSVSGSTQIFSRTSTSTFGTFTIEAGGTFEITGSSSFVDAKTIVNNGNVVFNRGGSQTLLSKGGSTDVSPNNSADFTSYTNLSLRTSGAKTIPSGITINVSGTLTLAGTASSCILASTGGSSLTYSNGATFALAGSSIALTATSLEWPATNGPTNITVNSNTLSFAASAGISRTVTGTFTLNGGNFTTNTGNTLTFANGATIVRGGAASALNQNSGTINYGTASTDVINVTILPSSTITLGNELTGGASTNLNLVGTYGTLTIGSGATYTMASGRTIANLANSGTLVLSSASTNTFTVNGNFTGTGTISGHDSVSIAIGGNGSGSAGTINFTSGFEKMNNLTINRTGTNGSVTINQNVTINRNITLTAGTLAGGASVITLKGGITGSGIYTSTGGGKIVMNGTTSTGALSISSATLSNIELASNAYSLSGSPIITGTLDLKNYVLRTSTSNVNISATGSLSRTSGWIFGGLRKNITAGANVATTFEIGDSLNYVPLSLVFDTVSVSGDFTARTTNGAANEPNYASFPLSKTNYVNRYWTMSTSNGLTYTKYAVTLNYLPSDIAGSATSSTVKLGRFGSGAWTTTSTTSGTNANTINDLTGTGNFILANCETLLVPSISITTASTTVCSGSNV